MEGNKIFVPLSIIIAGLLIAGAVMFTNNSGTSPTPQNGQGGQHATEISAEPVTEDDHIQGDIDADIVIVEYSDFECPFCARFHPTMEQIMAEYGAQGKVAWVYRHFPLRQIHPRAQISSEASECVAKLGGDEAFWSFADSAFSSHETSADLSDEALTRYAIAAGVSESEYTACVESGETEELVNADYADGLAIAQVDRNFGTPYSLIMVDGEIITTIAGAQPYTVVKQIVDTILAQE